MKKSSMKLTTAQFAGLHRVNKRTLHYYDSIGLFSPNTKGENGYRYYDLAQSMDFEYILMLKELNMSISEIEEYIKSPSPEKFTALADSKERELDSQIKKLKYIKKAIRAKREQLELCTDSAEGKIEIIECGREKLLFLPYDFADDDISNALFYMKDRWSMEQIRMGVGGMIAVQKVFENDFSRYDGIYTPALGDVPAGGVFYKPAGEYICCCHRGKWDTLPLAYRRITDFAEKNNLRLTGYAYETGLNEFAISKEEDYVTKITVRAEKIS